MAVKIRMKRLGTKKRPFYRIVVADSRRARDGRFIDQLGFYNPVSEPKMFRVDADKAKQWIKDGAQPSDTVSRLFREYEVLTNEGVILSGVDVKKAEPKPAPVEVKEEVEAVEKAAEAVETVEEEAEEATEEKAEEAVETAEETEA